MTKKPKQLPPYLTNRQVIDEVIRVDHAGEYGAKRIYQGQLAVLKNHKEISHMMEQELEHLNFFEKEMKCRQVRPTILSPLWHIGGLALGAVTAFIGEKAAMACTVAVEEVISNHYQEQLEKLKSINGEKELIKNIEKFKEDEMNHRETGIDCGAEQTPGYMILKGVIKTITKSAIFLSKKF